MENKKISIFEKLSNIQNEMNVPKDLYNSFGGYNYRNAESILEAAKPVCKKYRATLTIQDKIMELCGRFYVEAIARLSDWDSDDFIENKAYAREADQKKGMDESQVTGSCSSYARKYALNGLFNLDDVKDADSNELGMESKNKSEKPKTQSKVQQKSKTPSTNVAKDPAEIKLATKDQIDIIINYSQENAKFQEYIVKELNGRKLKDVKYEEAAKYVAMVMKKKGF